MGFIIVKTSSIKNKKGITLIHLHDALPIHYQVSLLHVHVCMHDSSSRQVAVCYCGDTENKLHTSASKPSVYITLALDFCYADMTIHRVIHLISPQLIFQQCCHKVVNTGLSRGCCNFVSGLTGGGGGGGGLSGIDCGCNITQNMSSGSVAYQRIMAGLRFLKPLLCFDHGETIDARACRILNYYRPLKTYFLFIP